MSISMVFRDPKFRPLFWTQFLGALNDNFLKNAMVVMVEYQGMSLLGLDPPLIVALSGAIFILPFFLFSMVAGQLADYREKSRLVRLVKVWELMITLVASVGFYLHHLPLLLIALFMMGMHSTFFGPIKYSAIPDLVDEGGLVAANAYVESGTFLAILLGTIGGGVLIALPHGELWIGVALNLCAVLGLLSSWQMLRLPSHSPGTRIALSPIKPLIATIAMLRQKAAVYNSVLGISWFWFFGAAVLSLLPPYCKDYLRVDEHVITAFLAMFTVGIGVGSILCERLSFKRVEIGLVPIGSLGMTIFLFDLSRLHPALSPSQVLMPLGDFVRTENGPRLLIDFFLMSVFGGYFILPLYTLLQERSDKVTRSRVIAGNNVLNAVFMVAAALIVMTFHVLKVSLPNTFMALALANLAISIYIYFVVPEFTLRFYAWIVARALYRLRYKGEENIPATGAALLICNHVSYVDWLIIMAAVRRPVRFIMYYKYFQVPLLQSIMRQAKVIPIAGAKEDQQIFNDAFAQVSRDLRAGELVCIFPEGHVTRDGELAPFKHGIKHILARDPVPVIPMALGGLWGSVFSFEKGNALIKIRRKIWSPMRLTVSPAISADDASVARLESEVRKLL